ncbi:catalase [Bryocella elongata]|uniref:Catalase-related peroxidase n=1 Tax=Bryocella elongata TaxID=863522 RepID=A0A1H6BG53_9BACT|nr:catalase family peroxidase [Bryocella elongata]SEG59739.1 catalase [Bryocella elongata]
MPLPQDERIVALANDLLAQFEQLFGAHPGHRPAHAKGILLKGTFTPSAEAPSLSSAAHLSRPSVPVFARFSNSTGVPVIPDSDPNANPRGLAIRFYLAEHSHTDIVAHSTDGFPTRDGYEFLELLKAIAASGPDTASPKPVELFLGSHPTALAFVQAPKPFPVSLATDTYFGVTAFEFTNADGKVTFGRYRIVPEAGNQFLTGEQAAALAPNAHYDELPQRLAAGPVRFHILVQLAEAGDVTDDATQHWPESRTLLPLGTLELTGVVPDNPAEQQKIIFDPIPRIEGIAPSADPLLELRAAAYLLSGRKRRTAPPTA